MQRRQLGVGLQRNAIFVPSQHGGVQGANGSLHVTLLQGGVTGQGDAGSASAGGIEQDGDAVRTLAIELLELEHSGGELAAVRRCPQSAGEPEQVFRLDADESRTDAQRYFPALLGTSAVALEASNDGEALVERCLFQQVGGPAGES